MIQAKKGAGTALDSLLSGALVGAFTTVLNNPLDVIKSRMQADSQGAGTSSRYSSTYHCVRSILRDDGIAGLLFKGLPARLVKISMGQAVIFFTYEHVKNLIATVI